MARRMNIHYNKDPQDAEGDYFQQIYLGEFKRGLSEGGEGRLAAANISMVTEKLAVMPVWLQMYRYCFTGWPRVTSSP